MSGDLSPYLALVTSQHRDKARFIAALTASLQPIADTLALLDTVRAAYDLDTAVGAQLDVVGLWVGRSRNLEEPLPNVYFSWDDASLGWGAAVWKGPFDPDTGLVALPDEQYRTLLRFQVQANNWDGTIPDAYRAYDELEPITGGISILIQDRSNMTFNVAIIGGSMDVVTRALLSTEQIELRAAGVKLSAIVYPAAPDTPFFGFGAENDAVSGWGVGAWGAFDHI